MSDYEVEICVVSYNQQDYIKECLESILMQETLFKYRVIVSDDCSNDDTVKIIKELQKIHSNLYLFEHDSNIGALENFYYIHTLVNSKYVCHCDGDDYWLKGKLQTQYEFMESNPKCNISWTRALVQRNGSFLAQDFIDDEVVKMKFYFEDILNFVTIGFHSTKMYRFKGVFERKNFQIVDYYANLIHVGDGYAAFVSMDCLAVYRAGIGIASDGNKTKRIVFETLRYFSKTSERNRKVTSSCCFKYAILALKNYRLNDLKLFMTGVNIKFLPFSIYSFITQFSIIKKFRLPR